MIEQRRPGGRPRRYARFEEFEAGLPQLMAKRPLYCDGIGLFRGAKAHTVWLKLKLPRGGAYRGRSVAPGGTVEIKLGNRTSWTWAQLIAERDRLQGLADRGEALEDETVPTFAQYAEDWLGRRKGTIKGYGVTKGHVRSALSPTFGRKALDAITPKDISNWIGKQRSELKPATVQRQLSTFNAILNDAVRNGVLESNPSARADKVKGVEARQRFITDDEWARILATADEIETAQERSKDQAPQQIRGWLRHFLVWAYESGMRRGEILNLRFEHIRPVSDDLTVVEVVNTKSGAPRFVTCTKKMNRIVDAMGKLERMPSDNRLFPVSMTTVKRSLTKLWKATELNDVRLHDLRRTHATKLIQNNIDPRTVAGRLGHSGTAMLATRYAVNLGDMLAAQKWDEAQAKMQ